MEKPQNNKMVRYVKSIEETPQWLIDNLHLKEGYRVGYTSIKSSILSLFHRHNDLMNIWTHLIGAIIFICFLIVVIASAKYTASLYSEFKREIQELNVSSKIRESYKANITPLIENMKSFSDHIGGARLSKIKDQFIERITATENDYLDALSELIEKFQHKELDLLKKFKIEYARAVQNIMTLKTNFVKRLKELRNLTTYTFKGVVLRLENQLGSENFLKRLRTAVQLDLELYPIAVFILSAVFCLGASAVYHTFYVMSPQVNKFLHRIDMAGINILNFGSVYAVFFYFFYCSPKLKALYIACSFVSCLAVFFVSMGDKIHAIENLKLKGLMFGGLGVSNVIPLLHVLFLAIKSDNSNDNIPINRVFVGLVLMGALYLIGLTFYVFKVPERYYPKTFDIWLNSHTIWHLFVFAAACVHLYSVVTLYQVRKNIPCTNWL